MAGQAVGAAASIWQVSVPLLAVFAAVSVWHFALKKRRLTRKYFLILLPFLVMLPVLLLGAVSNYELRGRIPWLYGISLPLVNGLSALQLLLNIGLVAVNRGFRWLTVAAGLLEIWLGFWVSAVAGMSISGVWL
jgi:hypothetical protein